MSLHRNEHLDNDRLAPPVLLKPEPGNWIQPTLPFLNTKAMAVATPSAYPQQAAIQRLTRKVPSGRYWLQAFALVLIFSQVALLFLDKLSLILPAAQASRVLVRMVPFSFSILLLAILPRRGTPHPATRPAVLVLVITAVSLLHPTTNTLLAGTAHAALYLAILAPLLWVPRLKVDAGAFRRMVLILWGFHTLSAAVGVLQVYFPGQFQPSLSSTIAAMDEGYLNSLQITTASGQLVFRPMGLTDQPGGAATAGLYALLFAMGFLLTERGKWIRFASVGSILVGAVVLYLSQVRVALVVAGVCVLVLGAVLAWRRDLAKLTVLSAVIAIAVLGGFMWAVSLGGESVTRRLATFVADDPTEVYQSNRGLFLEHTINELLPRYPFGAGLGRWGMMNRYFGENSNPDRAEIWVEIQWTGWLLDGGVPLIVAYVAALLAALWTAWRIAQRRPSSADHSLPFWGALVLAYNVGAVAWTFVYPLFIGQLGMEFWLLNAALFAAARSAYSTPRIPAGSYGWNPT